MRYTLGFIGVGNMGGALAAAASKKVDGEALAVCDADVEKMQKLAKSHGIKTETIEGVACNSRFVVMGVKPVVLEKVLSSIAPYLQQNPNGVLVSMAAGVSIKEIRRMLGDTVRPIIRIMPNTPCMIGEGVIQFACDGVSETDKADFKEAFSAAGLLDEIEEGKIDAASALSGCGPAFVYLFAEALADGAVECGLPRDKAILYAARTLMGAGKMVEEYGHVSDLKDAVCSPGGTTIAGVHALEKGGLRGTVMDAVVAAYEKTVKKK